MSDIYQVVTPENIELDYAIAGIGSRFLPAGIDLALQGLLLTGAAYALHLLNLGDLHHPVPNYYSSLIGGLIIFGAVLVIFLGYYIILETVWNGQTLGKKIVNIRVRKEGGYAPAFWDILLRNIIRLVDFFPFFYGIGFVTMFLNNKAKRLGDFAAATIVVKETPRKQFAKYLAVAPNPINAAEQQGATPADAVLQSVVPLISRADYLMMKDLVTRRASLSNYPTLAATVLQSIFARIYLSNQPSGDASLTVLINRAAQLLPELVLLYEKLNHF